MKVLKRNGSIVDVSFDKISYRIKKLINDSTLGKLKYVDADMVTVKVISAICDGISTIKLDELSAEIAISLSTIHPEYGQLASRIIISNMHKNTTECFSEAMEICYANTSSTGEHNPLISHELISIIREHKDKLNFVVNYTRDYLFDYFGFKTLEKSYLLKILNKDNKGNIISNGSSNGSSNEQKYKIIERPQHMWLRVALGLHKNDIEKAIQTYELMSQFYYTHATPTLYNSGTPRPQMSSCNLIGIEDSMLGIYKCLTDCAMISKFAGGIGVHLSTIRAKGSYIKGTNGLSDGIVPVLKLFNDTARFANQGSKRKGAFAMYMEPWHADIFSFLDMKKNTGKETERARDLFYALWVNDDFMTAVENDADWYLMSEDTSPGLTDAYGIAFTELYYSYVKEGKYRKKVKAREIFDKLIISQIETGMPYMSYKDHVNNKCNQKNIGTIKSSNLCNEITLVSNEDETAVCNICTFSLSKYIEKDNKGNIVFNHNLLYDIVKIATLNMNNVIDYNFYPTENTRKSNLRHRPIAMGIQGLSNLFFEMKVPFESDEARILNKEIMETIQYAGWTASMELAKERNKTYETYKGSPISKGEFQHNLWGIKDNELSGRWDWENLRQQIKKYGVLNSMITALPPTASTSQILCNYESFEPQNSNFFMRSTSSGEFPIINKYLIGDLIKCNLWNTKMKDTILVNKGSIQNIPEISDKIKSIYKTIWEIPQKCLIDMSADRAIFVDQTQSLNIYMNPCTIAKLSSLHFYTWKKGLKTGMYYLRTKPATEAQQFTITPSQIQQNTQQSIMEEVVCSIENKGACSSCSG